MQNDSNNNNYWNPNGKGTSSHSFRSTATFSGVRKTSTSPPEISSAQFPSSPIPRIASMPVQDLHRRLMLSNNGSQPPLVPKVTFTGGAKIPRQVIHQIPKVIPQSRTPPGGQLEPLPRGTKVDEEKIRIQEDKSKKIKEGSPRKLPPVASTTPSNTNETGHKRKENTSQKAHDKYAKRARVFVEDVNDKTNPFSFIGNLNNYLTLTFF